MSTNAIIAVESHVAPGIYGAVRLHWDGDKALKTLKQFYSEHEEALALVALGNLSSLGPALEPDPAKGKHTFNEPQDGVTVAYHRDRDEEKRIAFYGPLEDIHYEFKGSVLHLFFKPIGGEWQPF